jgi:hypothetical protein
MSQSQEAPIWFNAQVDEVGLGMLEGLMSPHQAIETN